VERPQIWLPGSHHHHHSKLIEFESD
jgi:hypothetical protein